MDINKSKSNNLIQSLLSFQFQSLRCGWKSGEVYFSFEATHRFRLWWRHTLCFDDITIPEIAGTFLALYRRLIILNNLVNLMKKMTV